MIDAEIYANDFEQSVLLEPQYKRVIHREFKNFDLKSMIKKYDGVSDKTVLVNKSICMIDLIIENTGNEDIPGWELVLDFPQEYSDIKNITRFSDGYIYEQESLSKNKFKSSELIIHRNDNIFFSLSFRVPSKKNKYSLKWMFTTGDYKKNGNLMLSVEPQFIIEERNLSAEKESVIIEDYSEELKISGSEKTGCLFKDL